MSRDQKPGRANIIDGSAKPGRTAAPDVPPTLMPATVAAVAGAAPLRVRLFVILFVAASAIAGICVAVPTNDAFHFFFLVLKLLSQILRSGRYVVAS